MTEDKKKLLLLVEDEIIIAMTEKVLLEKAEFSVLVATSSTDALTIFRDNPAIDLILMDIDLGTDIDGTVCANQLLAVRPVPVVFLSNQTDQEIIRKVEAVASYGYVSKNSGITILAASIKMAFKLYEAELQIRETEIRQLAMISNISDVIGINRVDGTILYRSPNLEKWFGWKTGEIAGKNSWDFVHPGDTDTVKKNLFKLLEDDTLAITVEFRYRCKDGTYKPVELTASNLTMDPVINGILINYHDITARRQAEDRLRHVVRLYALLSEINQAIVRIKSEEELFQTICDVAINYGHFLLARISEITGNNGEQKTVASAAYSGFAHFTPPDGAINDLCEKIIIVPDIASDRVQDSWKEEALRRGCKSSAIVPFRRGGKVSGALQLYAKEINFFGQEEQSLLREIGEDITYALDSIDTEKERKRAEEAFIMATKDITEREVETLSVLGRASEYKDPETANHIIRVAHTAKRIARQLGLSENEQELVFLSSPLHDVGKLGIPDSLLLKPGSLTDTEFDHMKTHTHIGFEILKSSKSPFLKAGAEIALTHHEKFAGTGYPKALKGEEIPLLGRIVAVADAYDAMRSRRPYKDAWPKEKVIPKIKESSGNHFDPVVVEAFLSIVDELEDIYEVHQD